MPDSAPSTPATALRFGAFELRPAERRLLRDGSPVSLGARAIDLLTALASHRGRLLTKPQLLDAVWPDVVVEESNLHVQISALRKVLGPEVISTVPGRGYQFVAALADAETGLATAAPDPDPLPPLIGRQAELVAVGDALARHRLVTVTGTGGTGKTALARHVARARRTRHRHGVTWVDLLDIRDGADLPGLVAAALDLKLREASPQALAQAAAGLDLLLVLDNGEHLGPALAPLVDALLAGAAQLHLLVTSQAPLLLFGEQVLRLGGLAVPALACTPEAAQGHGAVALFVARAQEADRRFQLTTDNLDDVVLICRALDGSALALQVAAALLARLPLAAVRQGLDQRLSWPDLPQAGGRSRGLRSAVAWSLSLLEAPQQELFRRLAAFSGPADAPLLQQALADEALDSWGLVDALSVLVDRSLVAVTDDEPPRYQLLETPRALATEALALQGDAARWRAHAARAVAVRVDAIVADGWRHLGDSDAGRRQIARLPDLAAAFAWAQQHDPARAVSLGAALPLPPLASAWMAHAAHMQALAQAPGLTARQAGRAWLAAATRLANARASQAQVLAQRAVDAFAAAGDLQGEYRAWCYVAEVTSTPAAEAQAALARAAELEGPAWPPHLLALRARAEGAAANLQGDRPRAIAAYRRAVALQQAAGNAHPASLISLADAELATGQVEAASRHLMAVVDSLRDGRHDTALYGFALPNLVCAALMRGQPAMARRTAAEGWPHALRVGAEAWWADHLAMLAAQEGRHRTAASLLGLADGAYEAANDQRQALEARQVDGALAIARAALGEAAVSALRRAGAEPAAAPALRLAALSLRDLPG